jgi:hypothetical protein
MRPLVLAALLVLAPRSIDAKCAISGISPDVLASTSAVVVGFEHDDRGKHEPGDVAVRADWKFREAGTVVAPAIDPIAPGLAVYRFPTSAAATVTLEDGAKKTIATLVPTKAAGLKAPRVKKLVLEERHGRRPFARVTVTVDGGAPDRAIALVLADAKGKPLSWGRVTAGATSIEVLSRGRCQTLPNNTVVAQAKQQVTLFWVDDTGAKSPVARGTVTGNPAAADD